MRITLKRVAEIARHKDYLEQLTARRKRLQDDLIKAIEEEAVQVVKLQAVYEEAVK